MRDKGSLKTKSAVFRLPFYGRVVQNNLLGYN